jgi:diguanylate cyclase (GGDEF)-like protein
MTPRPFLRLLPRLRAGLAAALCLAAVLPAAAATSTQGFAAMALATRLSLDDPRAAEIQVRQRLTASRSSGDKDTAFWLQLALVDVMVQTDREADSKLELAAARALLPAAPWAQRHRLWLEFYERFAQAGPVALPEFRRQQAAAREAARTAGDESLLCALDLYDAVVQVEVDAVDEAWAALEAVDRCAAKLSEPALQAYAQGTMGPLAGRVGSTSQAQTYFQRALGVLGHAPARFKRAWLLDDLGWAQLKAGDLAAAGKSFEQVLGLSTEIADASGVMRGHEGLAEVLLRRHEAPAALRHARAALAQANAQPGLRFRLVTAQTQVVEALAQQAGPELAAEIERLGSMAAQDPTPRTGALIARSAARGLRALGRHEQAYVELERHIELAAAEEKGQRERDAQRLAARYDAARRDAENSALRYAADVARLELRSRNDRQYALWALVAALGLALAGSGAFFTRALRRRQQLADLALRDELTGAPNRRAVLAFAREQFRVTQRLSLPLTIGLIDLDRFKHINDTHGHATGDRVLEAFARAAAGVMRGQDRVGRWGGEEWLLVLPGTPLEEMPAVFERLRQALAAQVVPGLPRPHGVTFSMGAAQRQAGQDTVDALIAEADHQLYRAKAQGRDAVCGNTLGVRLAEPLQNAA